MIRSEAHSRHQVGDGLSSQEVQGGLEHAHRLVGIEPSVTIDVHTFADARAQTLELLGRLRTFERFEGRAKTVRDLGVLVDQSTVTGVPSHEQGASFDDVELFTGDVLQFGR